MERFKKSFVYLRYLTLFSHFYQDFNIYYYSVREKNHIHTKYISKYQV